jgi:hypothetical protein
MSDAFLSVIIILLFGFIYLITILGTNISHIKKNWPLYRCNPIIMPFASYFGVDSEENMQKCTMNTQSSFMDAFLQPLHAMQASSLANQQTMHESHKTSTSTINKHRGLMASMTSGIFNKLNNVLIEMTKTGLTMEDNMARVQGLFTTVFYMFRSTIFVVESIATIIVEFPFYCFAKNTIIPTLHYGNKPIQHLTPGTILSDNSVVTATMILDSTGQDAFFLDNTIVTGSHKVLHNTKWIYVKNHPDAISLPPLNDPIYCFNTTNKTIKLHNTTFSDWDDIEENDLITLNNECGTTLPSPLVFENIHQYLEVGFHPDTTFEMKGGVFKPIREIQLGEILAYGEIVTGCVTIQGNVPLYYHETDVIGTANIQVDNAPIKPYIGTTDRLYHLLTNTGTIQRTSRVWKDYNNGLERFFE